MLEQWKKEHMLVKIGTVCVGLAAVTGLILGFVFLDAYFEAFGSLLEMLPFDYEGLLVVILIAYYSIDAIVVIGLLFMKRWAYDLAVWWGILAAISFITSIKNPSGMVVAYLFNIVAAVLLFIERKSFPKK